MSSHEMNFRKRDAEKEAEQRRSAVPRWNAFSLMLSSVLGTGQVENDEFPPFRCRVLLSKRLFLFFFSFASFSSEIFNVSFIWFIRIPRFQSGMRCDIFHDTSMLKENVKRCERSVLFFFYKFSVYIAFQRIKPFSNNDPMFCWNATAVSSGTWWCL